MSKNKVLVAVGIAGALALVLGVLGAAYVYAQDTEPPVDERPFYGRGRFPGGGLLSRFSDGSWITRFDAVAEALGLDPTRLFERLRAGDSVAEIAEDQGVELDAVQDAMEDARLEARKQAIEEAAEEGRLSQEQADWMLEGLEKGYGPGGRGFVPRQNCGPGRGIGPRGSARGRGMGW